MEVLNKEAASSIDSSSAPLLAQQEVGEAAPLKYPKDYLAMTEASNDLEVPDAMQKWQKSVGRKMILWCVCSVAAIILATCVIIQQPLTGGNTVVTVVAVVPALCASLVSLVPPGMYLCSCWHTDMATQVRSTAKLACVAACLDVWAGLVTLTILLCAGMCGPVHKERCSGVNGYMLLAVACNSLSHMCVCLGLARVANRAAQAKDATASNLLPVCDA